ncbi:MAG: Hpt domain-containing protein [Chlorobi bacterium]|nr:Hpt domain-containing protein [Chlorobiota bacterium]
MQLPDDPILLELVPEFICSWRNDCAIRLREIAGAQDREELYRFGHTLKGSARQFGFNQLAECGADVMQIARDNTWDQLDATIATIARLLDHIEDLARQHGMSTPTTNTTNL